MRIFSKVSVHINRSLVINISFVFKLHRKKNAPGEDRTHDLKIMRLTRCLLRYRGSCLRVTNRWINRKHLHAYMFNILKDCIRESRTKARNTEISLPVGEVEKDWGTLRDCIRGGIAARKGGWSNVPGSENVPDKEGDVNGEDGESAGMELGKISGSTKL